MNQPPVIAIAGVTGAVGQEFLAILEQREFPFADCKMLASSRSAGKQVTFKGKTYTIEELTESSFEGVDIALFSCGGGNSKKIDFDLPDDVSIVDNRAGLLGGAFLFGDAGR